MQTVHSRCLWSSCPPLAAMRHMQTLCAGELAASTRSHSGVGSGTMASHSALRNSCGFAQLHQQCQGCTGHAAVAATLLCTSGRALTPLAAVPSSCTSGAPVLCLVRAWMGSCHMLVFGVTFALSGAQLNISLDATKSVLQQHPPV